jgi:NAD(P)-dependent dehydrogenase (short-subunit alcohol dehydrogenase family)
VRSTAVGHRQGNAVKIAGLTVLVTGGDCGRGGGLIEEALRRGAKRVYAGANLPLAHDDRVTPLMLDIRNAAQIRAAVAKVDALDILINNASIPLQGDLNDRATLERLLSVNLFSTYEVTQAFLTVLARSRGAVVNALSLASTAPVPCDSLYWISKAATSALSESLRFLLAGQGVSVHAVLPGRLDCLEPSARAILDGVEREDEEIFPDSETSAEIGPARRIRQSTHHLPTSF